ncbi:unnamed protein product [Effrenium voratum]|nr:unnamed protein product [Effrenium voratum]
MPAWWWLAKLLGLCHSLCRPCLMDRRRRPTCQESHGANDEWLSSRHVPRPEPLLELCHVAGRAARVRLPGDWEIPRPSEGPNASPSARPEGPKKTYRAGQRITARRLRAAQREAETAAVDADANEDSNEEQTEGPRKPRRRAGVRVRRRREHALRRREAEALGEAEAPAAPVPAPVPAPAAPGPREKAKPLSEVAAGPGRRSLTSRPLTSRREKACEASHEAAAEQDIIGEKILVNGLQAPNLGPGLVLRAAPGLRAGARPAAHRAGGAEDKPTSTSRDPHVAAKPAHDVVPEGQNSSLTPLPASLTLSMRRPEGLRSVGPDFQ